MPRKDLLNCICKRYLPACCRIFQGKIGIGWLGCLDTVQDFLIKLGIIPPMHLMQIGIFSQYYVIVGPTKIMNNLLKDGKIPTFKVIFQHQKSMESFRFFFSWRILDQDIKFYIGNFLKTLIFNVLCFLKMCPIFVGS